MKKKILFYTDSPVFGGHEKTLIIVLEGLVKESKFQISVMLFRDNDRLVELLAQFEPEVTVIPIEEKTEAGDVFRAFFNSKKVKYIQKKICSTNPDLIIISQGAIGLSACGLKAAKNTALPTVSYLPMAHPVALVIGKKTPATWLQDLCYKYLYGLPDYFITICKTTKEHLTHLHGIPNDRIYINYFGFDPPLKNEVKYHFNPTKNTYRIGIIARVEFNQKQHDKFLTAFARSPLSQTAEVEIIGDGPDLNTCKELVARLDIQSKVHFTGWMSDVHKCYQSLDVVVIPSRFEGLPLVLLEAMTFGVPVVATRVDGMEELLPSEWLFNPGDWSDMLDKLNDVFQYDQSCRIVQNQEVARRKLNRTAFQTGFQSSLLDITEKAASLIQRDTKSAEIT